MSRSLTQFRAQIGFPQEDNNSSEKFALGGGLAIEEVAAIGDPAKLLFCKNYEPNYSGGYRSKGGAEPVDGHRQPSAFMYVLLPITRTDTTNNPTQVGQQVNQVFDGATDVSPFFLGWETLNGIDYIVLTNVIKELITTSFDSQPDTYRDVLQFPVGTALYTGSPLSPQYFAITSGAATFIADPSKSRFYISLARKIARSFIGPVGQGAPSGAGDYTGPARGAFDLKGSMFAIRDKADGTEASLFTCAGGTFPQSWVPIDLGSRVYFTACNSLLLAVGATVTGASTSTCTVNAVVIMFGTIGGGDATGYFVSDDITNGPLGGNAQALKVGMTTVATTPAAGNVQVANSLPVGGNYRFKRWNFTGVGDNTRIYGINGVGTAFEIECPLANTANFTPIITGQGLTAATFNADPVLDTPNVIEVSHDQLWLAYPGGNLLHSGYQAPTGWTAVVGADQRMLGDDVTNLIGNINNTLIVTTRNRMRIVYGDVNENYQMRDLNTEAGAYAFTAQPIGGVCFLTDEGVQFYDQTANFGNYAGDSLSQAINSLLKTYMSAGFGALEATIQRDHSFYRLYFDKGVCFTFCIVGKELRGIGKCEYELGSTVYLFTDGAVVTIVDGDTIMNDETGASFKYRRSQELIAHPTADVMVITDIKLDPAQWPAGSAVTLNGTTSYGTVVEVTVNSAKNFWSVASTITNGNDATPPGERIFFCSDDGYVYEDDAGGCFGIVGNPVDFEARTQFYYGQQPNNEKYYRRMYIDVIGADAFSNISFGAEYDDGSGYRVPEALEVVTDLLSTSGFDQNSVYGIGFYGGAGKNVLKKHLHGAGVGISVISKGSSDIAFPHTIQAVQIASALRSRRTWR